MSRTILVTGGAGFIGSNFIEYFLNKYPNIKIINLDKLTYAGNLENLKNVESNKNYKFIKGDICNRELVEFIFREYKVDSIIHFAAESHVDNSIESAREFIKTNVEGTLTLLDVAKEFFKSDENRFCHISTDEVYGSLSLNDVELFTEKTKYSPNSPYSASKASSDMLVKSYFETFGLNTVITNCSNNYGEHQHKEKLIPKVIKNALELKKIPIYGDGKNIRDWLYVLDHCRAIDLVFFKGLKGESYNIGSNSEVSNIDLANKICSTLDKLKPREDGKNYKELITFVKDRLGHDLRYAIDSSKIQKLGWSAKESFDLAIEKTIKYYLEKF